MAKYKGEVWMDVPNTSGRYKISHRGRVITPKHPDGTWVNSTDGSGEYIRFSFTDDDGVKRTKYVHQLVAEAFIPNDDGERKVEIDHINGNRYDNHVINLRWCTHKQNCEFYRERLKQKKW